MAEDLSIPGRELFSEYPFLAPMYIQEVRGLTEAQIDRRRPEKSWGRWSIREQVSHMAYVNYRWFLQNWGEALFGKNPPRDMRLADTGGADRMLDPKRFHAMSDLLLALEDGFDLAWGILGQETLGSLRQKAQSRRIPAGQRWPSGDSLREWTENVILKVHPSGYWRDERDPDLFHYDLEFTFRHVMWEAHAHLRTIQAHKAAEDLDFHIPLDEETGYLKALRWE